MPTSIQLNIKFNSCIYFVVILIMSPILTNEKKRNKYINIGNTTIGEFCVVMPITQFTRVHVCIHTHVEHNVFRFVIMSRAFTFFFCFHFTFYHRHRYHQLPSCRHSLNLNNFCLDDVYAANRQNSSDKKKHWSCSRNKNEKNLLTQDKSTNLFIWYVWEREKNASDRKKENCNINSGKHAIRMDPMSARMYWCHLLKIHSWILNLQKKKSCLVFKYKGDNEYSIALALLLLTILIWFYEHVPLSRSYPPATAAAAVAHIHIHLNISYTNRLYILQYYN